jgi:hypothetical protein
MPGVPVRMAALSDLSYVCKKPGQLAGLLAIAIDVAD